MNVLYTDDWIVVAEKPRGVLSEGSDAGGMPALLAAELGSPVLTVHRLDRETAGLMVFARSGKGRTCEIRQRRTSIYRS